MYICESDSSKLDRTQDKDLGSVPRWKQNGDAILNLVRSGCRHSPIKPHPFFWFLEVAESLTDLLES